MKRLSPTLAAVFCAAGLGAQDTPAPPVIRGGVELVRVDVVVTDRGSRHVTDLQAGDFTIEEDGHQRTIAAVRYVVGAPPAAPVPTAPAVGRTSPDPDSARRDDPQATEPRSMVIVLDDATFSTASRGRVPPVIGRIIDERASPDMPVAILRTGGGASAGQDFTADTVLLRAVLSHLRPAPGGLDGIGGDNLEPEQRVQMTLQVLRNMETLVEELADRPGRKTLLIVSEGMGLSSRVDPEGVRALDQLRRLTNAANRANVTISTVDPSGLVAGGSGMYSASTHFDPFTTSEALRDRLSGMPSNAGVRRQSLSRGPEQLAAETGGIALASNDIAGAVARAWDDQDGYYLIGYEPDRASVPAPGAPPVEHTITVRVARKGLTVRARRVYYARAAEPSPAAPTHWP